MAKIVTLQTDDGQELKFLIKDTDGEPISADPAFRRKGAMAPAGRATEAEETLGEFSSYFDPVRRLANDFAKKVDEIARKPSEVEVSVGIKLTTEAGIIFAKAGGEAEMTVKLVWKP